LPGVRKRSKPPHTLKRDRRLWAVEKKTLINLGWRKRVGIALLKRPPDIGPEKAKNQKGTMGLNTRPAAKSKKEGRGAVVTRRNLLTRFNSGTVTNRGKEAIGKQEVLERKRGRRKRRCPQGEKKSIGGPGNEKTSPRGPGEMHRTRKRKCLGGDGKNEPKKREGAGAGDWGQNS